MEKRIVFLDTLRGIAILSVAFFHAYVPYYPSVEVVYPEWLNFTGIRYGFLGVQLFFLISGFVILMTLERSKNFITFMYKRWIRLFPTMLVVSIIVFTTAFFFYERPAGVPTFYSLLPGLTFIEAGILSKVLQIPITDLEGAFWSLYVEIKFYIIFGLSYFILGKQKALYVLFILFLYPIFKFYIVSPPKNVDYFSNLFSNFGLFFSGCLAFIFYDEKTKYIQTSKTNYYLWASIIVAFMSLILKFQMDNQHVERPYQYGFFIVGGGMFLLFYLPIYFEKIRKFYASRILLFLGFVSYAFYLIHENMMLSIIAKISKNVSLLPNVLLPIIAIGILSGVAYLITKYMEPKVKKVIDKSIKKIIPYLNK